MRPIAQHHRTKVDIIADLSWTMDDQGPKGTSSKLSRVWVESSIWKHAGNGKDVQSALISYSFVPREDETYESDTMLYHTDQL
jgi:hypothetical protein